jgi:hypothetical protein
MLEMHTSPAVTASSIERAADLERRVVPSTHQTHTWVSSTIT